MDIHPDAQKLLDKLNSKGKLTGHETGRLFIFNAISKFSKGKTFIRENLLNIVNKLKGEQKLIYDNYVKIFYSIGENIDFIKRCTENGKLACDAACKTLELVQLAKIYPTNTILDKYTEKNFNQIEIHKYYNKIKYNINIISLNKIKFKIAGIFFKTQGFENMLDSCSFDNEIQKYNSTLKNTSFIFEKPKDLLSALSYREYKIENYNNILEEKSYKNIAKFNLKFDTFLYDFRVLDEIILERLGYEK